MTVGNRLYPIARSAFLTGALDWTDGGITVTLALLDNTYAYDDAHQFASDLVGVLATGPVIGRADAGDGVADADDQTTITPAAAVTVAAIVLYVDTGDPTTSTLIYYADENDDTTPINRLTDGSAVPVLWSGAADRVFRL